MSLFDLFRPGDPEAAARAAASEQRRDQIERSLAAGSTPPAIASRLRDARGGRLPWTATLTPSELRVVRSHGLRPIATVSATCWLQVGWSWTEGHAEGWHTALTRLRREAVEAGANAVLDVKLRTIPLAARDSMDFSLIGTAVRVEGLTPSPQPIAATVPTLEFVRLLEADVVPTGIAIGACYDWLLDPANAARRTFSGNTESTQLSRFWDATRRQAQRQLALDAKRQGNGVLAHVNFGQLFEFEASEGQPRRYLGRHIVVGTVVDARPGAPFPTEITPALDLQAGTGGLRGAREVPHHQSYDGGDQEGAI